MEMPIAPEAEGVAYRKIMVAQDGDGAGTSTEPCELCCNCFRGHKPSADNPLNHEIAQHADQVGPRGVCAVHHFAEFRDSVERRSNMKVRKDCDPQRTEAVTGVPAALVERAAHAYGRGPSLLWIGQGTGRIKGSFMTGEVFWAEVGALCLVAGGVIAAFAALGGRRGQP